MVIQRRPSSPLSSSRSRAPVPKQDADKSRPRDRRPQTVADEYCQGFRDSVPHLQGSLDRRIHAVTEQYDDQVRGVVNPEAVIEKRIIVPQSNSPSSPSSADCTKRYLEPGACHVDRHPRIPQPPQCSPSPPPVVLPLIRWIGGGPK